MTNNANNKKIFPKWGNKTIFLLVFTITACSAKISVPGDGIFAQLKTDKGDILLELEYQKAPMTAMNFIGLAEGLFDAPNAPKGKKYFDGLKFHRVEPGFVIQGGDPNGNGTGGPGYQFPNEINSELKHDRAGVLSMANAGADTNGSQFFITLDQASFLDGNYSIFGHVVEGQDVVGKIEVGDAIEKVTIIRQGSKAKAFKVSWEKFQALSQKVQKQRQDASLQLSKKSKESLEAFAKQQWPNIKFTEQSDGLLKATLQSGSGSTGNELGNVKQYRLHYTLWAPSATGTPQKVDSSRDRKQAIDLAPGQVIPGWSSTMPQMQVGEKLVILVPPELGYGKRGSPPVILPNSYLLFEMELLDFIR